MELTQFTKRDRRRMNKLINKIRENLDQIIEITNNTFEKHGVGAHIRIDKITAIKLSPSADSDGHLPHGYIEIHNSENGCVEYVDPPGVCQPCSA